MKTKIEPAASLPWARRGAVVYGRDKGPGTAPLIADCGTLPPNVRDAAYIVHAANAYPWLVELLQIIGGAASPIDPALARKVEDLLRRLGELQ